MKYKFGKDMHIMVDVLTYCHKLGAEDFAQRTLILM